MNYRFIYNGNESKHTFKTDAEAMIAAREELRLMKKLNYNEVHVWEQKPDNHFRYIVSYK